ncbi:MAG: sigma-70 family RNA polymerase sigma factor [Clostridia bacterium]|nr:sigma-70 family RNA polymerase sigma factor [Clostridia bacterium]
MDVVKGPDSSAERIDQWISLYEKELLRLCFVYLKDEALAEDAVQETFLKAYSRLSSFRGDSSPKTWLVRIAINVCKDMSRTSWFRMIRSKNSLKISTQKPGCFPGFYVVLNFHHLQQESFCAKIDSSKLIRKRGTA